MYTPRFQNSEKNRMFFWHICLWIRFKTLYRLCIVNSYLKSDFEQDFNLICLKSKQIELLIGQKIRILVQISYKKSN